MFRKPLKFPKRPHGGAAVCPSPAFREIWCASFSVMPRYPTSAHFARSISFNSPIVAFSRSFSSPNATQAAAYARAYTQRLQQFRRPHGAAKYRAPDARKFAFGACRLFGRYDRDNRRTAVCECARFFLPTPLRKRNEQRKNRAVFLFRRRTRLKAVLPQKTADLFIHRVRTAVHRDLLHGNIPNETRTSVCTDFRCRA